jgi:predicted SAM-dependent methyltransferase
MGINLHQDLITKNHELWNRKPILRTAYQDLYRIAAEQLSNLPDSKIVELGSGMGHIRDVIPQCITTELFPFPWIDRIENAYQLSFEDESISDLISTDVFHHLKYPGTALIELHRVLRPGGRVILLEPCMSLLGLLVYGVFHAEPIAITKKIEWLAPAGWSPENLDYYAAQGNASRIFVGKKYRPQLAVWQSVKTIRLSALTYAASGGYSGPQLYPTGMYQVVKSFEKFLNMFPALFATRLLVVLEKRIN